MDQAKMLSNIRGQLKFCLHYHKIIMTWDLIIEN